MSVLSKNEIKRLIMRKPPLIDDYINLDEQLQPNGFDLTLRDVSALLTPGIISVENSKRVTSELKPLDFDKDGNLKLAPGNYLITLNEIVHLPNNIMALAKPRSSLLRCGVAIHNAVWDAGYTGRSQCLLVVYNPQGFVMQKHARVNQLVFFKLDGETEGYQGKYQGENI
ncbi:MAG: deoxyuridine 5'-triphosphate nucleotidohydrolase [Dehalococcoidales bacterium]|nr:deoxyuridine 5'-triphosphate nucleotidohydrolase [Dehalococcoidales bacterium]